MFDKPERVEREGGEGGKAAQQAGHQEQLPAFARDKDEEHPDGEAADHVDRKRAEGRTDGGDHQVAQNGTQSAAKRDKGKCLKHARSLRGRSAIVNRGAKIRGIGGV